MGEGSGADGSEWPRVAVRAMPAAAWSCATSDARSSGSFASWCRQVGSVPAFLGGSPGGRAIRRRKRGRAASRRAAPGRAPGRADAPAATATATLAVIAAPRPPRQRLQGGHSLGLQPTWSSAIVNLEASRNIESTVHVAATMASALPVVWVLIGFVVATVVAFFLVPKGPNRGYVTADRLPPLPCS